MILGTKYVTGITCVKPPTKRRNTYAIPHGNVVWDWVSQYPLDMSAGRSSLRAPQYDHVEEVSPYRVPADVVRGAHVLLTTPRAVLEMGDELMSDDETRDMLAALERGEY